MTTNFNSIHGSSVVTLVTNPDVIARLHEEMKETKHIEITYIGKEEFADGFKTYNVYFLADDPHAPPPVVSKRPTAKVPPVALKKRFTV